MPKIVAQCRKYPNPNLHTLNRTITYVYTLSRLLAPHPNKLTTRQPIRATNLNRVVNQSKPSTEKNNQLRQPIRIEYYITRGVSQSESRTHQLRQPIRIQYYITRVVSQSETSITSPEISQLGWRSLLGSWLKSARYSLS